MTKNLELISKYTACPACHTSLITTNEDLRCPNCLVTYRYFDDNIPSLLNNLSPDTLLGMQKWDKLFNDQNNVDMIEKEYQHGNLVVDLAEQVLRATDNLDRKGEKIFLELGSGSGTVGEYMMKKGWFFIAVDYSAPALMYVKRKLQKMGLTNFLLIQTDIQRLGVAGNSVDLIYGGGVLEHFKDTQPAVDNLYRILRKGGTAYNAVPYLNPGNMVYRSQWGGVPNIPILRDMLEFIHVKVFKSKHMVFGYELQFTRGQLRKYHIKSGFKPENIKTGKLIIRAQIHLIKIKWLKKFFIYLCEHCFLFWPMVYVTGTKE